MSKTLFILFSILTLSTLPAWAGTTQSHAEIREVVSAFVRTQTQSLPGKASFKITDLDPRISLPACPALEAFLPAGAQLNGNSSVGVRCNSKHGWSIFVQVNVKINVSMLTFKRTMQSSQTVRADDLGVLSSETVQAGALTEAAQAIGKIMKYGVGTGQIVRHDMLRAPYTVKQGDSVQLRVKGTGFSVSTEGLALSNAAEGEITSARTASGQIVSGIASAGAIEIAQ